MRRIELPASLGEVFTVAEARAAGVTRSRLRARDVTSPHRGLHRRTTTSTPIEQTRFERLRSELVERAREYARIMPESQFFSHVVATAIWNVPVPLVLLAAERDLDVATVAPVRTPRRVGIRGHELKPHLVTVVEREGLRVADAASTWAMMAPVLRSDAELVALGDAFVRERIFRDDPEPRTEIDELHGAIAAGRRQGIARLRDAVELVRTRSASPGESRCRIEMIAADLPEPELNVVVRDHSGRLVAVVDLAYPSLRIAIEYEGEQHLLDPVQWERDIARHEALVAMGWIVIRVTRAQLYGDPAGVIVRIRRAISSRVRG